MLQGVVHHDADGKIIAMNPAAVRILGKTSDQFLGSSSVGEEHHTIREDGTRFPGLEHPAMVALRVGKPVSGVVMGVFNPQVDAYRWINIDAVPLFRSGDKRPSQVYAVFEDITERKLAEGALRRKEAELRDAQRVAHVGSWYWDAKTDATTGSDELLRIYGFDPATQTMPDFGEQRGRCYPVEDWERVNAAVQRTLQTGVGYELDVPAIRDGNSIWVTTRSEVVRDAVGQIVGLRGTVQDITARKRLEAHQALLADVLLVFNRGGELRPLVDEMLRLIRAATGFEAVGLRLRDGDDCPYFAQEGFAAEFVREENLLCLRNSDGTVRRDPEGLAVLQCTCGLVLAARTDPSLPCFTARGSSWTNAAHEFLLLPPEMDLRTNPRNRCIHCGYESVGLFPVRAGKAIIGLLQLNDRRPGRFSPELIAFYETLRRTSGWRSNGLRPRRPCGTPRPPPNRPTAPRTISSPSSATNCARL